MMDEYGRLLAVQQQLEKEADGKVVFFGLGLAETMRACLMNGMVKRADKLKGEFRVPDKRCVAFCSSELLTLTTGKVLVSETAGAD